MTRLRIVQGARGEFGLVPLHRGVRPLPFEHMAHHDPDAAFVREGEHVWDELQRFNREHPVAGLKMPSPSAAARRNLRSVTKVAAIAIAVFTIAYFAAQMLRAVAA